MKTIIVNCSSNLSHTSQILCGFHMLEDEFDIVMTKKQEVKDVYCPAHVEVVFDGKKIIYDVDDGYQNMEGIRYLLSNCDFYFKRSFSEEQNEKYFCDHKSKMFPLGFNYHVSFGEKRLGGTNLTLKKLVKKCLGYKGDEYFTSNVFEGVPGEKIAGTPKILFYTRLWEHDDNLSQELNDERQYINETRIQIIRQLKKRFGKSFKGGVAICPLAYKMCPDLILSPHKTRRDHYLKALHHADICIGSMGLHKSIGWKTAEYVAAAKAIVSEEFCYSVPGDFSEGQNYFSFKTVDECMEIVETLARDKEKICAMKKSNREYYKRYLHPRMLVKNTLDIVQSCAV